MTITNDTIVTLYDPHPGFAGATIPIPATVKRVADDLDGQTMPLGEAIARIQAVTNGRVEYVTYITHQWIRLWLPADASPHGRQWIGHSFRVIRFREVDHVDQP